MALSQKGVSAQRSHYDLLPDAQPEAASNRESQGSEAAIDNNPLSEYDDAQGLHL
jgi:hypothetical protein